MTKPNYHDDLPEIIIQDGEVTGVFINGVSVHALVRNYDVGFPAPAESLKKDSEGNYYTEAIVFHEEE